MKIITSRDNSIYKAILKLTKKKYRDETGTYLLEGVKPVRDALDTGIRLRDVIVCEGYEKREDMDFEDAILLSKKLFGQLTDTKTSQGVIAVAEKRQGSIEDAADRNLVVLDRLQDPGNIGTIIRTAEAAGYGGIVVMPGTTDIYSPKVVRAAAGSLFRMPVIYGGGEEETVEMIRGSGRKVTVTSLSARNWYYEADLDGSIALVIGNEGRGVSEGFIRMADISIKIPMEGSIESLNAAVAAGILMYQSRKR